MTTTSGACGATLRKLGILAWPLLLAAACGGGGGAAPTSPPPPPGPRTIGGTVSGLTGTGLVLRNNGGGDLTVAGNGAFTFAATVDDGGAYAVTVRTQPTGQACDVTQGTGTVAGVNVTGVTVTCRARATAPIAFLYFPNAAAPTVHAITPFGVDEVGGLHALAQGAVDTGGTPVIAADPTGRHLYAAAQASGVIHYAIGADGALSQQEVTTPPRPYATQIVIHPNGQWAYVASCADATCASSHIDLYTVGADGALAAVAGGEVERGDSLRTFIDPSGHHAYTVGRFTDTDLTVSYRTLLHQIQADGTWGAGTNAFYYQQWPGLPLLDPTGARAYYSGFGIHDRYTVESDGHLTQVGTYDVGGSYGILSLHPSGQFAYAVRTFDSVLVQFTVGTDGALTSQGSFQALGQTVGGVVVDPSGRFAYASAVPFGYGTRGVLQYDVDAQGKLTPMAATAALTSLGGFQNENLVIVPAP